MIKRYGIFFKEADKDGGGGTALLDPPAGTTSVADVYKAALAKEQDEPIAESVKEAAPKEPAAKKDQTVTQPAVSALDAALEIAPSAAKKEDEIAPAESLLKGLPETLPREGRGDHWSNARGIISSLETASSSKDKTIADLTKQLETAKTAPPEAAQQLKDANEKLAQYKDAIVALNVNFDPEHRAKFVDGRVALVTKAASKLSAYGGNGDALKTALELPEGRTRTAAIKEALTDLEDVERTRVLSFVSDIEKLDDERAEIEKDPQGAWDKLQKTQAEAKTKESERAETYKKSVFNDTASKLVDKIIVLRPVADTIANAAQWNKDVTDIKEGGFKLLGADATPEELSEAALWAKAGPKLQTLLVDTGKQLKTALARIAEYEKAEPGFRGGKGPAKDEGDKPAATRYSEALEKLTGGSA